jgi:hypothetical protein
MKKIFASIFWIVLLNGAFTGLYVTFTVNFNPTITSGEAYNFGETFGAYFFVLSVALIVYLAATNRLPGAGTTSFAEKAADSMRDSCGICSRKLDQMSDPLSLDCGGDCWGCIGEIEADMGEPSSLARVREEFALGLRPSWHDPGEAAVAKITG